MGESESENYTAIVEQLNKFREELETQKARTNEVVEFNKALLGGVPQTKEEQKKDVVDLNKYLKEKGL